MSKTKGGGFERRPPLPEARLLEVFVVVARAVAHLHGLSPPVTHRDLKLENVLGLADGTFVLCDFGSATETQASRRITGKDLKYAFDLPPQPAPPAHAASTPSSISLPRRSSRTSRSAAFFATRSLCGRPNSDVCRSIRRQRRKKKTILAATTTPKGSRCGWLALV